MVRMTTFKLSLAMALSLLGAVSSRAAEIRGRVTDPQGAAIPSVAVIAQPDGSSVVHSAQTDAEGGYLLSELPPGRYLLRAQKAGYAEQRQGPLDVAQNGAAVVVNFRLAPGGETEAVRGAEERNPNDFIFRLDNNAILNEMIRTGTSLRLIQEFRADRNVYGEPFGYPLRSLERASQNRVLGAYHGSVYDFHQDHALNARPFFQVGSLLPSRRNQYGFSFSGPILRERLSFNFAWGQVRDSGFVNGNVQVPRADERVPRSPDPEANAIIAALLKAYPDELPNLPHVSIRHLNTNALRDIRNTAFSLHLDYQARSGDRVAYDQQFSDTAEDPFELVLGQNPQTAMRPQSLRLTYSRSLSPRTVAQISLNYDRLAAVLLPTERYLELLEPLGILEVPDIELGDELSNIGLPGQGILRKRFENRYLLAPQLTHTRGRHALATGASMKHLRDSDIRTSNGRGTLSFNADFSIFDPAIGRDRPATAVENFLLGRPSRLSVSVGNQYRGYRNSEYIFYFHDRFQVRGDLLLNWGLRYEVLTVPHEVNHLFEFIHDTDANNFAPQFGFAWSSARAGIVVRGGYGIAFGNLTLATWNRQASNPPLVQSLSVDKPDLLVVRDIPSLVPVPGRRSGLSSLDREAALPYSHIYNLTFERELPGALLLRAGYQGSRTIKLFSGLSLNRALPVAGIETTSETVNRRRPDPRYLRIYNVVNGSIAYMDSLQISATKRRTRGLSYELRYSFSKTMDTGISNFADTGSGGDTSQTEEWISDVKALSSFDTPHAFTVSYSYELPSMGAAPEWLSLWLGRWTVSGTTTFRSGTPFTAFTGSDAPGFGNVDGEGSDRPNLLNPKILGASLDDPDTSTLTLRPEYFDTNISAGGRGNIGYRTFRKDGTNNWNLALARSFLLPGAGSEKQLQFRAEFFNFFNHAQFSAPGTSVSSPTFGQITNTVNKGRVTQLTLRFLF
jgi:hypothetical protein